MSNLSGFAQDCRKASKDLRFLPRDLKRQLASDIRTDVAQPLATRISGAARGSYGRVLAPQVKARSQANPTIAVGGGRRLVSGGATGRDLVYGTEFGGGRSKRTRQFVRNKAPFIFPTIGRSGGWVLDRFADIVDRVLGRVSDG